MYTKDISYAHEAEVRAIIWGIADPDKVPPLGTIRYTSDGRSMISRME